MAKNKTVFVCQECGYRSLKWVGRCSGCGAWNTMEEENCPSAKETVFSAFSSSRPTLVSEIVMSEELRISTSFKEVDRVLGGGIVPGSLILLGGDPGIGKSTILLQIASFCSRDKTVLYVSGEESLKQIKMRAERLHTAMDNLYILAEINIEEIEKRIQELKPELLVIDSIQMVYNPRIASVPGSISQIKECAAVLLRIAKTTGIPVFLVGHITKEGNIAGPRVLEHMVDTVLYFEGEKHYSYRILRSVKNRFGSTNEIGIFEMLENGLQEVANPSAMLLAERTKGVPGAAIVSNMEGTRPILVEVQSLVAPSHLASPRRATTGLDYQRISLLLAVLEKRMGFFLAGKDVYVNVVGGLRLTEPSADLGVVLAIASSFLDKPVCDNCMVAGEVGLTGEVRSIGQIEARIAEADKLGFSKCFIPGNACRKQGRIEIIGLESVEQALKIALGGDANGGR